MKLPAGNFFPSTGGGGDGGGCLSLIGSIIFILIIGFFIKTCFGTSSPSRQQVSQTQEQPTNNNSSQPQSSNNPQKQQITEKPKKAFGEKLSGKLSLMYHTKIHNINIESLTDEYIQRFDEQYRDYKDNEFELHKKKDEAKNEMSSLLSEISFENKFVTSTESKLGEYNFDNSTFEFNPFIELKQEGTIQIVLYGQYITSSLNSVVLYFVNTRDFNTGVLRLPKEQAEQTLNQMPKSEWTNKIDRTVYVKIYYDILNVPYGDGNLNSGNRYLGAFINKIEIYIDKELSEKLITTLVSSSSPNDYSKKESGPL